MYNLRIIIEHHVPACRGTKHPQSVHRAAAPQSTTGRAAELTQQLLIGAEAVGVGRVQHGDTQLAGSRQRRQTLRL